MNILRRGFLAIFASLFLALLFVTATDFGVTHTLGRPNTVKHIIVESGVYNSIIPSLLDQAKTQTSGQGSVSLTDPIVKQAATEAISPVYLRQTSETTIDSVYAWLEGKTSEPDFRIDLSAAKLAFANSVASQVAQKAATLPVCTSAYDPSSYDALSATCLPPGVTPQIAAQQVKNNLESGKGFLDNPVVTADNLKNGNSNKSVFADQLKGVPRQYQLAQKTPYILTLVTLLLAGLIVLLSSPRRRGLKRVGLTLLIVGLFMLVFAWALNREVGSQLAPRIKNGNPVIQQDLRNLATDLSREVRNNYWMVGAVYAVVGAAAFAGATYVGRSKKQPTQAKPAQEPPTAKPAGPPVQPKRPAPKKIIKIQ